MKEFHVKWEFDEEGQLRVETANLTPANLQISTFSSMDADLECGVIRESIPEVMACPPLPFEMKILVDQQGPKVVEINKVRSEGE